MPTDSFLADIPLIGKMLSGITLYLLLTWAAVIHVLLNKRNSRAAFGWVGLILVFPIAGALLYALFGINRVRRKAQRISAEAEADAELDELLPHEPREGADTRLPGFHISARQLIEGNRVTTCHNGEQAYPLMLESIDSARNEVLLSTYIFDNDATALRFVDALQRARERGCKVRLLIDDAGLRYSFPTVAKTLKERQIPFRRFSPLRIFPPSFSINMRTHRKVLVCDRRVSYAGGMNIGDRQLVEGPSPHKASDLHFRFDGAITDSFVRLFADDWKFAGGEDIDLRSPGQLTQTEGSARCRLISDGPDENMDALLLVINGAMVTARDRIWIMSPYFLPERQMMGCLQAAALAGVDIRVVIPASNNWPLVQWALQHNVIELLNCGVKILQRPAPFAHSKCLIIDDQYSLVGSSNLDPRSLRLNFELGVEVFDAGLNTELSDHFEEVFPSCHALTTHFIESRSTLTRLRDAASSLFSPYL